MQQVTFRMLRSVHEVPSGDWDSLQPRHVLTSHAWLSALEDSGVVAPGAWLEPRIPALMDATGRLAAAAPGVLRRTTAGDFGPENLWIRAAEASGVHLLPKLQIEVPPAGFAVPKLLVRGDLPHAECSGLLVRATIDSARAKQMETVTISRIAPADEGAVKAQGLLISNEVGSLWRNEGYGSYSDFLSRMKRHYRNTILAERRRFRAHGLTLRELRGSQITAAHWDAFYEGYVAVCRKHGSRAQLNRDLLDRMARVLGDSMWLFAVFSGDRFMSGSYAIQHGDTLLGGHWSELEFVPNAIFEVGLYRPVEVAIELGLKAVDQGGWEPHKPKRGFMPVMMNNAHWIRDAAVREKAQELLGEHRRVLAAYETPSWAERHLRSEPPRRTWPPDVSIVIATIGRASLLRAVDSIFRQRGVTHIQLLIGLDVDKYGRFAQLRARIEAKRPPHVTITWLDPGYSTSEAHGGVHKSRFGGSLKTTLSFLAASAFVMYLDDDDWLHEDHCAETLAAIQGRTWSFALCMYADGDKSEAICVDELESVGVDKGVYSKRFGGFVRTSGLLLDKRKVPHLLHLWSTGIGASADAEDRLIFDQLRKLEHGFTGRATVYYALDPRDGMHPVRLRYMRSRGKDFQAVSKNESVR